MTFLAGLSADMIRKWQAFLDQEGTGHVELIYNQGHVQGMKITDVINPRRHVYERPASGTEPLDTGTETHIVST